MIQCNADRDGFSPRRQAFPRVVVVISVIVAGMVFAGCETNDEPNWVEANDARSVDEGLDGMTLGMKSWTWVATEYGDGRTSAPIHQEAFTLTFDEDRVRGTTDCNHFNGAYTLSDREIRFDEKMAMTRKYCSGSQERVFVEMLQEVDSFRFTNEGALILESKANRSTMQFR